MHINEDNCNEWQKLIEEQKASGLSKAVFCKQKGIKADQFYYHASILIKSKRMTAPNNAPEFVPVQVKKSIDPIKSAESCVIRIILKNGIECILPDEIESKHIKEVVEILQQC